MEEKLFLTDNGYEFLENYLKSIYGERGTFEHNLQRYVQSDFFNAGCRYVNSIDDLPLITFDEIKQLVAREEEFRKLSLEIQSKYDVLREEKRLTREDYLEIAGIMGLAPGHTDREFTLFPNLLDLYVSSKREEKQIWDSVCSNIKIVELMVNNLMDGFRQHQVIEFNGRQLLSQGYARNYFRGENNYYYSSKASIFRNLGEDEETEFLIRYLKLTDFSLWLSNLECAKAWPYGDVFHGAVAQHYGIATNGMDVTSNLKIALFFACCRYDNQNNKWVPLSGDDIEESRYGILYAAPADVAYMSRIANIEGLHITDVTPVGIQPFQRCEKQSAYLIETGKSYDMLKDMSFSKVKFRLDEDVCQWIYHEMKEGELVYPNEGKGSCQDVADKVNLSKQHTLAAFDYYIRRNNIDESEKLKLIDKLGEKGYTLCDSIEWCSKEREQELNTICYQIYNDIKSTFRFGFCI